MLPGQCTAGVLLVPGRAEGQLPSLFNAGHLSPRPKLTYAHANWLILNPAIPGRLACAFSAVVCVCCFILLVCVGMCHSARVSSEDKTQDLVLSDPGD